MSGSPFELEVADHDRALRDAGLSIWVGAEPTFTDRQAQTPAWIHAALGDDKLDRALALWLSLARQHPGTLMLRSIGRSYPGESQPRWNLGLYRRRDDVPLWQGPPDPAALESGGAPAAAVGFDSASVALALAQAWTEAGLTEVPPTRVDWPESSASPVIDLPRFDDVGTFLTSLRAIETLAKALGWPALVWGGHLPPVDAEVELTSITPDPAVIEINAAPDADASAFLRRSRTLYTQAQALGLSPYRLYFNGQVADSGGGGQITLGGASPATSPFFTEPRLLPRLVRYFNRHPALSYLYAHDFVGSSGQSVRADERGADALDELRLALALIDAPAPAPTPEGLWQSLAPFLSDAGGNSHRAEVNIEKLCNPFLPDRGRLGLVEFRGLRMQHRPERAAALACLLCAVAAMLARSHDALPVVDWAAALHDRFALPFYLQADLQAVLARLQDSGFGLGPLLRAELLRDEFRFIGSVRLPGCVLEVRRAVEFWPVLGDVSGAEQAGSSRLVDASTARVELRLRPWPADAGDDPGDERNGCDWRDWRDWQVHADGLLLPLREEHDGVGPVKVFALRWRSFQPNFGLHPMLASQSPLQWRMAHPLETDERLLTLHEWQPDGAAYDGLPLDLTQADARRNERLTMRTGPAMPARLPRPGEPGLSPCTLDLRHRASAR